MGNSRARSANMRILIATFVALLTTPGLAESTSDRSELPQADAASESHAPAAQSSTRQTKELDHLPWQDRANEALANQRSGALEAITASSTHFGSQTEASEFSKAASGDDPTRQKAGAELELHQTWYYTSEGPYDEPGPVQVHMVNVTDKAISGLLFEFIQGPCDEPDHSRSYHVILAEQPVAPSDQRVLIVRIPPRYLTQAEQCGTILEAW